MQFITDGWEKKSYKLKPGLPSGQLKNFLKTAENIAKHISSVGGSLDTALGRAFALTPAWTWALEVEHDVDDLQHWKLFS